MAIKKNVIKTDIASYRHYWRGVKKVGKSTLFRDLVLQEYGTEDAGLLISFADEEGYKSLDKLQYEVIEEWIKAEDKDGNRGFKQLVDDLVKNRNTDYADIKLISYDTYDKMLEVGTKEVLREHTIEKGQPCKSINDAFGGFNRGVDRLKTMIQEQTSRLEKAGYGVIAIGHTKYKEKKDKIAGDSFEQITSSLRQDLDAVFADTAHVVMTITVDNVIEDNKLVGTKRVMHFRDDGLVDCGGRFSNIPESMPLGAKEYVEAFNIGVKNSFLKPVDDKTIEKMKEDELKQRESSAKDYIAQDEDEDDKAELLKSIVENFSKSATQQKNEVKEKLKEFKILNFKDVKLFEKEQLEEILSILNA